jgi:hypothetical protein
MCRMDVASICDPTVSFSTQVLACKFLRKCQKDQVPMIVIMTSKKCIEGLHMNWETFFLNQFLIDYEEAQDKGTAFHYAWLLILIALEK